MNKIGTNLAVLGAAIFIIMGVIATTQASSTSVEGVTTIHMEEEWHTLNLNLDDLEPEFVAVMPDAKGALVTIQEGSAVAAINLSNGGELTKIIMLPKNAEPDGIAVFKDGTLAVTANEDGQSISLIDMTRGLDHAELTDTIDVLSFLPMDNPSFKHDEGEVDPEGISTFMINEKRYVVLTLEKAASILVLDVSDIDNVSKVSLLPVGFSGDDAEPQNREAEPEGISVGPAGDLIAVGNEEEGSITLIPIEFEDGMPTFGQRVDFDPSGKEAEIVTFSPDQNRLLVTNSKENSLVILDISDLSNIKEIRTIDLSTYGELTSVAVAPHGRYALVSLADGTNPTVNQGTIVFISLESYKILDECTVGQVPDSIGITPDGRYAVVANEAENEDDVTEDDQIVGSISIIDLAIFENTQLEAMGSLETIS